MGFGGRGVFKPQASRGSEKGLHVPWAPAGRGVGAPTEAKGFGSLCRCGRERGSRLPRALPQQGAPCPMGRTPLPVSKPFANRQRRKMLVKGPPSVSGWQESA